MADGIRLERAGAVATLTIDRPEKLNALDAAALELLAERLEEVGGDGAVRVLVITGAGGRAFVAGADIAAMRPMDAVAARGFARRGHAVLARLESLPQVSIAAVDGVALGGGCELALACDLRVASHRARFGQPEVGLGIIPGWGGSVRLARLIGRGRAAELILTGAIIDAAAAERYGLVNALVAPEELMPRVLELAGQVARQGPTAVRLAKEALQANDFGREADLFALCFATADQKEGMGAFLAKRAPRWQGR